MNLYFRLINKNKHKTCFKQYAAFSRQRELCTTSYKIDRDIITSHIFLILRNLFGKNFKKLLLENHLMRFVSDCQGCGCRMHPQRVIWLVPVAPWARLEGTHTKGGFPADLGMGQHLQQLKSCTGISMHTLPSDERAVSTREKKAGSY